MPELPEVETIVRELRQKIIGLTITDFWSDREKPVAQAGGINKFRREIKGKKIIDVSRRAKYIVIDLKGDKTIFIHQKISGHLMYGKWRFDGGIFLSNISGPLRDDPENRYIRYLWRLSNGYQLAMADSRRFSRILLVKDKDVSGLKEIRNLGPEPLEINEDQFRKLFENKRGKLKQVLMDPFFIVGIGNIYSDEILWDSGYHPLSRAEGLENKDLGRIFKSVKKILKKAINARGSSIDDYRTPSGEKGTYQDMEKAYQQTGKKCFKNDGGVIKRLVVGGRSAHFCPVHQKLIKA